MYIITTTDYHFEKMYLAYQDYKYEDLNYFWTNINTFCKIFKNSTKDHPFLFETRLEAIKFLKKGLIPQKCKIEYTEYKGE